jgi:hypothetical protein
MVGLLAVAASLMYVAIQIRSGSRPKAHKPPGVRDQMASLYADEALTDVVIKGLVGAEQLTLNEAIRFSAYLDVAFAAHQANYTAWRDGDIDEANWQASVRWFGTRILAMQGVQNWWPENGSLFPDDYRYFVDQLIAKEGWKDSSNISP